MPDVEARPPVTAYSYRAVCTGNYDGDTICAHVDLGFGFYCAATFRLAGIDAAEIKSTDPAKRSNAMTARDRVRTLLPVGVEFTLRSIKDRSGKNRREKFGRYLCHVVLNDGTDLNALLVSEGLAVNYDGGSRGVVPPPTETL